MPTGPDSTMIRTLNDRPADDTLNLILKELGTISIRLDKIELRLAALEHRMAAVENRFDCLEEGLRGWIGKTELRLITMEGQ